MNKWLSSMCLVACGAALAGCVRSGTVSSRLLETDGKFEDVSFAWTSTAMNFGSGEIATSLSDGSEYRGRYRQVRRTTETAGAEPIVESWVAARLTDPSGTRAISCRFVADPGGAPIRGSGTCVRVKTRTVAAAAPKR